jgi:hypothetical protein
MFFVSVRIFYDSHGIEKTSIACNIISSFVYWPYLFVAAYSTYTACNDCPAYLVSGKTCLACLRRYQVYPAHGDTLSLWLLGYPTPSTLPMGISRVDCLKAQTAYSGQRPDITEEIIKVFPASFLVPIFRLWFQSVVSSPPPLQARFSLSTLSKRGN